MKRVAVFAVSITAVLGMQAVMMPPALGEPLYCENVRTTIYYSEEGMPEVAWVQLSAASKKHYRKMQRYARIMSERTLGSLQASSDPNRADMARAWRLEFLTYRMLTTSESRFAYPIVEDILTECGAR